MGLLDTIKEQRQALTGRLQPLAKQTSHRPDLAGRVHIVRHEPEGGLSSVDRFADNATIYRSYVWVRKAVGRVVDAFSSLPVRVEDEDGEALPNHPISGLLSTVNDSNNASDLWEDWGTTMLLGGENFIEIEEDQRARPAL